MKKVRSTFLLLFTLGIALSQAQTIEIATIWACATNPDPDMTVFGSEGSPARNIYRGHSDLSSFDYEVRWSTVDNRWEIRFDFNHNGTYSVTYYNTTPTAPNPPALGLGNWVNTVISCGTLTVFKGSGTVAPPGGETINVATSNACAFAQDPDMTWFGSEGSPTRNIYRAHSFTSSYDYEVRWSAADNRWELRFDGDDNGTYSYITHYNTTATVPNPPALGLGDWVNTGTNCGALTLFNGNGTILVLPIELLHFGATTEQGKNTLTWSTASEINNQAFDIERSADGRTFDMLGQIKAANQPGNYQFIDDQPLVTSYYRLRQTDLDGTATYSKIVSVTLQNTKALKVYPTLVADGFLTVDTEELETVDFSIYNLLGQSVQRGQITARLDVSALPTGTYILQVGAGQAKFVKP